MSDYTQEHDLANEEDLNPVPTRRVVRAPGGTASASQNVVTDMEGNLQHLTAEDQRQAERIGDSWQTDPEESVAQRPRDRVTSHVSRDLPAFVDLLNAIAPTVARMRGGDKQHIGIDVQELDRAGQLATLQAVATFLKPKADGGDQQAIADLASLQRVLTAAAKPPLEDSDHWFDEMYEPWEGGFQLRDRGEGGAIPVRGAAEWIQSQAGKVIEMPQEVTTEQAAEMRGGAPASAGPVVWSGADVNKVYGKGEEGYLPPSEAGFNSLNMRPLPAGDKRGHLNWDGRIKADSPLGVSLMKQFGTEKPLRDAKGNPTGNRYVKITDGNYVTLVALGGEYLLFDTKSHGTQAGLENLLNKVVWNGQTKPKQFIPAWLGANKDTGQESEGGKAVEKGYIGSVEETFKGFKLGEELDPKSLDHLFAAWVSMATHEARTANAATTDGVDIFLSAVMEDGFEFRLPGRNKMTGGDLPKEWNPTEWRKTVTSVTNQDGSVNVTMGGNTVTFSKTGAPSVAGN